MTMKTIKYMGMALIMAALASCSSDDDFGTNWQNDPTAVRVSATVGGVFTRSNPVATTEAEQMKFNEDDAITISTEGQASVNYILKKDGTWGPETSGQFLKWSSEPMTFTARYPKGSGDFIVPLDQDGIDKIASADYMTATTTYGKIPDDRKVNFYFNRQMARVVITIAGFNNEFSGEASVPEMWVTSKERIAKDGSAVTATSEIIPYSQDRYGKKGSIYYALVAPNTATNYEFIKLRVKSSNLKTLTVKNPVALEAGKSYNFNLTIGKNGVSLGTVSVEDWGNKGTISGGEASAIDPIDLSKAKINITDDGYYVITTNGKKTTNTITISGNATVQLKNAVIDYAYGNGIDVKSGSPTIIVSGTENRVTSKNATAINVCNGATLTIKGTNGTKDKLTAQGGSTYTPGSPSTAGAGIGSSDGGNIVIENVSIEAAGGNGKQDGNYDSGGAGIGSSSSARCGYITISNAVITATGGNGAPGIGMGVGKNASAPTMGEINIKFSTITATGGSLASAIGFPDTQYFGSSTTTLTVGGIYIQTSETSETFLSRLKCNLGNSSNVTIYKIGKGRTSDNISYLPPDGSAFWDGVMLEALEIDGRVTSYGSRDGLPSRE